MNSHALFKERPDRLELLALPKPDSARRVVIAVHRNHSFELLEPIINVYLGLSGIQAEFAYGGYDDSMSFAAPLLADADVQLLWFDAARHEDAAATGTWLGERVAHLRRLCDAKILVASLGLASPPVIDLPDVLQMNLEEALSELGDSAFDERLAPWSGTRLSNAGCIAAARELGTHFLPALLCPLLKAIVLDCDNTLYAGVLGEDGISGCTPYTELQGRLRELGRQGFLLALASKNEEADVRALFARRTDFPLRWDDLAAWQINWAPKAENIAAIARDLHIGTDAILFVDDNPGEIAQVQAALPDISVLEAVSPEDTLAGLRHYPRLFKSRIAAEDAIRGMDLRANKNRESLMRSLSLQDYLRDLHIHLTILRDSTDIASRCHDLCNKANQFIFSLLRPTEADIAHYIHAADRCVVAVGMRDRLSDSGIIAVLLARRQNGGLIIDEFVVSCRALGRGVESFILGGALQSALRALPAAKIRLRYRIGPRNNPARMWLGGMLAPNELQDEDGLADLPMALARPEALEGYDAISMDEIPSSSAINARPPQRASATSDLASRHAGNKHGH